ncbi:putative amidoligase domain-containing protein [Paenibacillus sanfengchensis]|uniref:putative amidoligase domain-containing protein n=1 Tax=Paenibacillus sanfengchensis TaxID=3119819 RepID=UPI002FE322F9
MNKVVICGEKRGRSMEMKHVLKIKLEGGVFSSRLMRAFINQGGPYELLRGPLKGNERASREEGGFVYGLPGSYIAEPAMAVTVTEWRLNNEAARFAAIPREKVEAGLRAAGLLAELGDGRAATGRNGGYVRRYAVSVFNLRALTVVPVQASTVTLPFSGAGGEPEPASPLWRRLEKTAVRALYTFGLDFGEVVIRAGAEGCFTVEKMGTSPSYGGMRAAALTAEAMAGLLRELEEAEARFSERLIGMDPEFLLYNGKTKKVVQASRYLGRQGIAGCDVLRYRGRRLFPVAELRPEPGREPRDSVRQLLCAFRAAKSAITDGELLWQAGGMPQRGFPLGGHLHFSGVPLTGELLRTLDNYLALPMALLEDSRSARRRPLYGFLGDFRRKDYGGFEYRTLPSFLISPLVAKGVLGLAALILRDYRSLQRRPLQDQTVQKAFYEARKQVLRKTWPPLARDIAASPGYPDYAEYIAPFLDAVQSGKVWDESADIRGPWKLQTDS